MTILLTLLSMNLCFFSTVEIHLLELDFKKFSIIGYMTASRTLSSGSDHGSPVALMKHRLYWFPLLSGEKWLWDMGNNCRNQLNWKVKYAMALHLTTIKSLLSSLYPSSSGTLPRIRCKLALLHFTACCRRKGLLIWMWLRQSKQKLFLKGREAG